MGESSPLAEPMDSEHAGCTPASGTDLPGALGKSAQLLAWPFPTARLGKSRCSLLLTGGCREGCLTVQAELWPGSEPWHHPRRVSAAFPPRAEPTEELNLTVTAWEPSGVSWRGVQLSSVPAWLSTPTRDTLLCLIELFLSIFALHFH